MNTPRKTALSVNVNKVALLRNTRHLEIPSVTRAAEICLKAGAAGITVHPRPDERHIRKNDMFDIAELMRLWPEREYNIEGNPLHNLMDFVRTLTAQGMRPHQATLVPDTTAQATSDHGWNFPHDAQALRPIVDECNALGVRVSLFMDPLPGQMAAVKALGAQRVELYTESWASAFGTPRHHEVLAGFAATAHAALAAGLQINAGHDLNRSNLTTFLKAVPGVQEVSIGHAFVADALEIGYSAAVKEYLRCIDEAFA